MWLQERHQRIMQLLQAHHRVSTDTLADEFCVSRETIRRDLLELEGAGHVQRVHGGAVLPHPAPEEPFQERMSLHRNAKKAIAKLAAALIEPGQCVLIDAGTTTSVFARELVKVPDVMIVTNSVDIMTTAHLSGHAPQILLLGGRVVSDVPGTYGELTLSEIARFNADVAVVSPVALHSRQGATDYDVHEAEVARAMIANAHRVMMLADHSKLETTSRVHYCDPNQIDILVTSAGAEAEDLEALRKNGVGDIVVAP